MKVAEGCGNSESGIPIDAVIRLQIEMSERRCLTGNRHAKSRLHESGTVAERFWHQQKLYPV